MPEREFENCRIEEGRVVCSEKDVGTGIEEDSDEVVFSVEEFKYTKSVRKSSTSNNLDGVV